MARELSDIIAEVEMHADKGINISQRTLFISGDINSDQVQKIDAGLIALAADSSDPITIKISSEGGSPYDAFAIIGLMTASGLHITTVGFGAIMSAATIILAAGNVRKLSRYAWIMHHAESYEVDGDHHMIKDYVIQSEREEKVWCRTMQLLTKKDWKFWYRKGLKTNFYMSPKEALEHGVVDEII